MSFVEDVTIGEGESIPPDTQFTKTWRIQNTGEAFWLQVLGSSGRDAALRQETRVHSPGLEPP